MAPKKISLSEINSKIGSRVTVIETKVSKSVLETYTA